MYRSDSTVKDIIREFRFAPARIPAAAAFNYHPTLAAQRLSPELGWSNYLANAALRTVTQGE